MRYSWKAKNTFQIMGFAEAVEFVGREVKVVPNAELRKALVEFFGTLKEVGDTLQFIGNAVWTGNDGTKFPIDADGFVEIDWDKFTPEEKAGMLPELEPA